MIRRAARAATVVLAISAGMRAQEPPDSADRIDFGGARPDALLEQLVLEGESGEIETGEETPREAAPRFRRLRLRSRIETAFEAARGYLDGTFAGDRLRTLHRAEVKPAAGVAAGAVVAKDPGESAHADFVSATASFAGLPLGGRIVAGDFRARAGRGILLGPARRHGKGASTVGPAAGGAWGIAPGPSSDETDFLRGLAVEVRPGPARLFVFGSVRSLSPLVDPSGAFRGIDRSGRHRTRTELERRDALVERAAGAAARIEIPRVVTAGLAVLARRRRHRGSAGGRPSPPGDARGSIELQAEAAGLRLFGEAVVGREGGSWLAGLLMRPSDRSRVVLVRRLYPVRPRHLGSGGFSDGGDGTNESGMYLGAEMIPVRPLRLSWYLDLVTRPGAPGGAPPASPSIDRLAAVAWEAARSLAFELRYRLRTTLVQDSIGAAGGAGRGAVRRRESLRGGARWRPGGGIECQVRAELALRTPETGGTPGRSLLLSFMAGYETAAGLEAAAGLHLASGLRAPAPPISLVEPGLPGGFSAVVLAGDGARLWVRCSWRASDAVRLTAKFSRLRRDDLRSIGSGPEAVPSDVLDAAGVQIDAVL